MFYIYRYVCLVCIVRFFNVVYFVSILRKYFDLWAEFIPYFV